jgi:hypothetical protein
VSEPVISPDGTKYWNGKEWLPIQNTNQITTGNIQDSVVQVSNDSEVVKAALDGAAKIINEQKLTLNSGPIIVQHPSVQYAKVKYINNLEGKPKTPIDKSKLFKWIGIIVVVICVSLVVITVIESQIDSDKDGVVDRNDAFPNDPDEWNDEDEDGVGDNTDECPDTEPGIDVEDDGCEIKSESTPNVSLIITLITIFIALIFHSNRIKMN